MLIINTMFKEYENDVSSYSDLFSSRGPFLSSQFYMRGYKVKLKRKKKKLDAGLFDFLIRNVLLIVSCILDNFYARGGYY